MLKTERLIIRHFTQNDIEDFTALILDKMASEYAPYDNRWPTDDVSLKGLLYFFTDDDTWYAVELEEESKVIGFVACCNTENKKIRDIGFTIHSDYQNKGYGYEACRAVMEDCMINHGVEVFTSGTADCNIPSVKLLKKLGFVKFRSFETSFTNDSEGNPVTFLGGSYGFKANKNG